MEVTPCQHHFTIGIVEHLKRHLLPTKDRRPFLLITINTQQLLPLLETIILRLALELLLPE